MNNKYLLEDGFKAEAMKMMETVVFKRVMEVARNRTPEYGHSSSDLHTVALQAKMREGYELALDTLLSLPIENTPASENSLVDALLDPRD